MPITAKRTGSTIFIRRAAFESAGLQRSLIDSKYNLTDDEFQIEAELVAIGPVVADADVQRMVDDLEQSGLHYFEDYFELSGNWPEWLSIFAAATRGRD